MTPLTLVALAASNFLDPPGAVHDTIRANQEKGPIQIKIVELDVKFESGIL